MRRTRRVSRARQSSDADTLIKLAKRLSESGTHIERRFWQKRLLELLNDRLNRGYGDVIEATLERLGTQQDTAYEDLAELSESSAESTAITLEGQTYDGLLIAIPVLAWSRYKLPAAQIPAALADAIGAQIATHLAARGTYIAVTDILYSIDQIPDTLNEVYETTLALTQSAIDGKPAHIDPHTLREPVAMLADTRYVLAAIVTPQGQALYHWQETGVEPDSKLAAMDTFIAQVTGLLAPLLTGCHYQLLAPDAFHAALREADRRIRAFSLEAAIAFLKLTFDIPAHQLQATVAMYEEKLIKEMRIGIGLIGNEDTILEGVVWPLLGDDEEKTLEDIENALQTNGVTRVRHHAHRFPLEFCDDCGAPMFPNPSGHSVHTEPPEGSDMLPATSLH